MVKLFKKVKVKVFNTTTADRIKAEVAIEDLLPDEDGFRASGNKIIGRCPLHDDNSPSFAIYLSSNSWYCFAEGKGGSVLDFYMQLHKVDFSTAVEALKGLLK